MKTMKKFLASLVVLLFAISITPPQTEAHVQASVNFQIFYDDLAPYGTWVAYPPYGDVWVPNVGAGFRPYYTDGRWVYADCGWLWDSYYPWGWAPFHYGSWYFDSLYGWMWIPGYDWAPAWVTWGNYNGYYGWAPYGPGIGFDFSYYPPLDYWCFVEPGFIITPGWYNHCFIGSHGRINFDDHHFITRARSINLVRNAGVYNGTRFSAGPERTEFERATRQHLYVVSVRDYSRPERTNLRGNEINIYRPRVDYATKNTARPSRVVSLEEFKHTDKNRVSGTNNLSFKGTEKKALPERNTRPVQKQEMNKPAQKQVREPEMWMKPNNQGKKTEMKQNPNVQERNSGGSQKVRSNGRNRPGRKSNGPTSFSSTDRGTTVERSQPIMSRQPEMRNFERTAPARSFSSPQRMERPAQGRQPYR